MEQSQLSESAPGEPARSTPAAATAAPQRPGGRLPGWVPYTALRIVFFLVPLVLVYGFSRNLAIAGVTASVVALCLSVIFLAPQRGALAVDIDALSRGGRRPTAPPTDESAEDAQLGAPAAAPTPKSPTD